MTISQGPIVGLRLPSRPETLTVVRGMLSGIAELLTMDPELLDDLKTSVSEACNNVVLHAYRGEPGPMDIRLFVEGDSIRVSVEDRGVGLDEPPAAIRDGSGGLGMSIMKALARDLTLVRRPGGGTVVSMRFDGVRDQRALFTAPARVAADDRAANGDDAGVTVTISPVALLSGVLNRIARSIAASAHFSLDRFADVDLIADALSAHAERTAASDRVTVRLNGAARRLSISLGPLRRGSGRLFERPGSSPVPLLADSVRVTADGEHERIAIVVSDPRDRPSRAAAAQA